MTLTLHKATKQPRILPHLLDYTFRLSWKCDFESEAGSATSAIITNCWKRSFCTRQSICLNAFFFLFLLIWQELVNNDLCIENSCKGLLFEIREKTWQVSKSIRPRWPTWREGRWSDVQVQWPALLTKCSSQTLVRRRRSQARSYPTAPRTSKLH